MHFKLGRFLAGPQSGKAATMCPKNENLKTPVLSRMFKQQLMPFEENLWRDLTCRAHSWDMRRKTRKWTAYFGSRICRWHVNDCTNWWGCKSQLLNVWGVRLSNWFWNQRRSCSWPAGTGKQVTGPEGPSFKRTSCECKIFFFFFVSQNSEKIKLEIDVADKLVSSGRFGSNFIVVNVLLINNVSHRFQPYGSNSLCFSCCPFAMCLRELAQFP